VGSPLTLELQELLSEVVKNVAERLGCVDEDEEHELLAEVNSCAADKIRCQFHPSPFLVA
jgi:hypothetical protein